MTKVAGQNETVVKSVKNWLMYAKFMPKLLLSIISRMKEGLINFGHNFCIPIIVCLSRSSFAVLILLLQWQMCQAMSDINNNKNRCCLMPGKRKRNKEGRKNKEEMWQLFAHLLSWVLTWGSPLSLGCILYFLKKTLPWIITKF